MAIQSLNYRDLSPDQRSASAARARDKIREQLSNLLLTDEQRELLSKELERIDAWEVGNLPEET